MDNTEVSSDVSTMKKSKAEKGVSSSTSIIREFRRSWSWFSDLFNISLGQKMNKTYGYHDKQLIFYLKVFLILLKVL